MEFTEVATEDQFDIALNCGVSFCVDGTMTFLPEELQASLVKLVAELLIFPESAKLGNELQALQTQKLMAEENLKKGTMDEPLFNHKYQVKFVYEHASKSCEALASHLLEQPRFMEMISDLRIKVKKK